MALIFIVTACVFLSAICMSIMDSIQFRGLFQGHKFWGKEAWVNKYKNYPIDLRPRFPGAKTFLVAFTDGWHHLQWWMLHFFFLPVIFIVNSLLTGVIVFVSLRVLFGLTFTLFFHKILNNKTND